MIIDFHTHGRLGKKLPFSAQYLTWHFAQAKKAGLDAICMTEHYNCIHMEATVDYMSTLATEGDMCVTPEGLYVCMGLEIDALEGGHFLAIGNAHHIQAIYQQLQPFLQQGQHPSFDQLVTIVKSQPVLFGGAHPFRASNPISYLSPTQLAALDFLELNGKDTALSPHNQQQVAQLANETGLPVIAGSDTHQAHQFGAIATQFEKTITTIGELQTAIDNRAYTLVHGPDGAQKVTTAKQIKSALKEIHRLGGDYVSILCE